MEKASGTQSSECLKLQDCTGNRIRWKAFNKSQHHTQRLEVLRVPKRELLLKGNHSICSRGHSSLRAGHKHYLQLHA